jgi:hypothetical protein
MERKRLASKLPETRTCERVMRKPGDSSGENGLTPRRDEETSVYVGRESAGGLAPRILRGSRDPWLAPHKYGPALFLLDAHET